MSIQGFVRVAAACPVIRVVDCKFNSEQTLVLIQDACKREVNIAVFPELGLTGYTCGDLFQHRMLRESAREALLWLVKEARNIYPGLCIVGVPIELNGCIFNCAAVFQSGEILGLVPKTFLPNYHEFQEARYFSTPDALQQNHIILGGKSIPFGTDLLFEATDVEGLIFGVELCEDLWVPIPPSSYQAIAGATILFNLSASNEVLGKVEYRKQLVANQSARCIAGYVYSSSGYGESSTDIVFGGHGLIAEIGTILAESTRFQRESQLTIADLDLDHILHDRTHIKTFHQNQEASLRRSFRRIPITVVSTHARQRLPLARSVIAHPFVPSEFTHLNIACKEIFQTQTMAMAKRLEHVGTSSVSIGVSGGLDSTLALIAICKSFDMLSRCRSGIRAFSMPGFGTSLRTMNNAARLMRSLNVSITEIDIRRLAFDQMKAIDHFPFGINIDKLDFESFVTELNRLPTHSRHDLVFENIQARIRTNLLMNTGFVIGTGDMSELALGWCTYNADQMSMYNPNANIPKTLVKFLVKWIAESDCHGLDRDTLLDIVATEISPELLPLTNGVQPQSTEATIGPYELHDFFLYHFLRWGATPDKILFLARHAKFDKDYSLEEIKKWLIVFITRFFANQFKRSCMPDGPKVGSVGLSPRGDWRMPSDAHAQAWLDRLDQFPSV
ncbi:MAG: NAD(+) synthase [Bacteroidales bacterium]|nr:NAD(+) synthase [Bacteroidales bacterium]